MSQNPLGWGSQCLNPTIPSFDIPWLLGESLRLARPCKFRSTVGVLSRTKRAYKDWSKCPYFLSAEMRPFITFCYPRCHFLLPQLSVYLLYAVVCSSLSSLSSHTLTSRSASPAIGDKLWQAAGMPGSWPQVATDDGLQWASPSSTCATNSSWRSTASNLSSQIHALKILNLRGTEDSNAFKFSELKMNWNLKCFVVRQLEDSAPRVPKGSWLQAEHRSKLRIFEKNQGLSKVKAGSSSIQQQIKGRGKIKESFPEISLHYENWRILEQLEWLKATCSPRSPHSAEASGWRFRLPESGQILPSTGCPKAAEAFKVTNVTKVTTIHVISSFSSAVPGVTGFTQHNLTMLCPTQNPSYIQFCTPSSPSSVFEGQIH